VILPVLSILLTKGQLTILIPQSFQISHFKIFSGAEYLLISINDQVLNSTLKSKTTLGCITATYPSASNLGAALTCKKVSAFTSVEAVILSLEVNEFLFATSF
jgi:hypothetical protein